MFLVDASEVLYNHPRPSFRFTGQNYPASSQPHSSNSSQCFIHPPLSISPVPQGPAPSCLLPCSAPASAPGPARTTRKTPKTRTSSSNRSMTRSSGWMHRRGRGVRRSIQHPVPQRKRLQRRHREESALRQHPRQGFLDHARSGRQRPVRGRLQGAPVSERFRRLHL